LEDADAFFAAAKSPAPTTNNNTNINSSTATGGLNERHAENIRERDHRDDERRQRHEALEEEGRKNALKRPDILNNKAKPEFYIMPEWWIANDIHERHAAYLKRYGGKRKHGGDSTHHSINLDRIAQWKDRWDILGLDLIDVE